MRIKGIGAERLPAATERGEPIKEAPGVSLFSQVLQDRQGAHAESWGKLLSQVDEAGKKLISERNMASLSEYREAVKDFMKKSLTDSYRLKEENRWDRRGNRRAFCIVEKVNKALEDLTTTVLENHEEVIGLMAKLDEIRGLLIDLYY